MDSWFDDLSRVIASPLPRRNAVGLILGGIAGGFLARPAKALFGSVESFAGDEELKSAVEPFLRPGPERCEVGATICRIGEVDQRLYCCPPTTTCCYPGTHRALCCESFETCCEPIGAATNRRCCDLRFHTCTPVNGTNRCLPPPGPALEAVDASGLAFSIRSEEEGLSAVRVLSAVNANVDIPRFAPGALRVDIHASKIVPSSPAELRLESCIATDAGDFCTPAVLRLSELRIREGKGRARETFAGVSSKEGFVTIQNGSPGVQRVEILVNGARSAAFTMAKDQILGFDVTAGMMAEKNTVTVVASGRPGGSALVTVTRLQKHQLGAKGISDLPRIQWQPASQGDINLLWGN